MLEKFQSFNQHSTAAMHPEMFRADVPHRALNTEKQERGRETAIKFYHDLAGKIIEHGGKLLESVNELLRSLPNESFVVRRDDPMRVLELLSGENVVSLRQDPKLGAKLYANAVDWQVEQQQHGLEQAFLEGHGHVAGVVTVAGYLKNAGLQIQKIDALGKTLTDIDRRHSLAVQGELKQTDLGFVIVRIPIDRFDVADMTSDELETFEEWETGPRQVAFIYRSFVFPQHFEHERLAA